MDWILRLKHWQLFLLIVGPPLAGVFIHVYNILGFMEEMMVLGAGNQPVPSVLFGMFGYMPYFLGLIFAGVIFGQLWMLAIGTSLHARLPEGMGMNLNLYKLAVAGVILLFVVFGGYMLYFFNSLSQLLVNLPTEPPMGLIKGIFMMIPFQFLAMAAQIYILYFAAKTIKSVETQNDAPFGEFVGEFFLIWFNFIGIWVLQPRLNKLVDGEGIAPVQDELLL